MKKYINIQWVGCLLLAMFAMLSCSPMDEYKDFVKGGEIEYTGRIDSVIVLSGEGRVIVTGLFMSDPKVEVCRIFWNGRRDSLEISIDKTTNIDTLKQEIELPENLYNFEIYTYDASGNKSVPVYANGRSYGKIYRNSINNRLVSSAILDCSEGEVDIQWRNIDQTLGAFATEVTYTNSNGDSKKERFSILDSESILKDFKGTSFEYVTMYRPDTLCVDTFKTELVSQMVEPRLDKSKWTVSASSEEVTGEGPINGRATCIFDDDIETFWHSQHQGAQPSYPHWLAVDIKEEKSIFRLELTPRQKNNRTPEEFLIEGSLDGQTWTQYDTFNLKREDSTQSFVLANAIKARHIRITFTKGPDFYAHLAEFTIFGY